MTVYTGEGYHNGEVSIGAPPSDFLNLVPAGSDVVGEINHWLAQATKSDRVYYFAIYSQRRPIGQILLHDIDWRASETLIGYHLFEPGSRGQGIGTQALQLLQRFIVDNTPLKRCVIITSRDNHASQRVAQKCGFKHVGSSREDPVNGLVYTWEVPAHMRRYAK